MSIINDALKKAQANLKKKKEKVNEPSPHKEHSSQPPSSNESPPPQPPNPNDSNMGHSPEPSSPQDQSSFVKENLQFINKQKSTTHDEEVAASQPTLHMTPSQQGGEAKRFWVGLFIFMALCGIVLSGLYFFLNQIKVDIVEETKQTIQEVQSAAPLQPAMKEERAASPIPIPPPPREISSKGIKLNGIMTMNERRVALINDEIYEIGDYVDGKRILNILPNRVVLEAGNGGTLILKVQGE